MSSQIEELRMLTSAGFKVVRLRPDSKIPANRDWQRLATKDLNTIKKWGQRCNVGVLTGTKISKSHRFVVLDVDNKNGKNGSASFQRLKSDFNLTDTVCSKSPNGGEHHYYLVPAQLPLSGISMLLNKLGYPGIDFLGEGLQVLESPSRLDAGEYRWVRSPSIGIQILSLSLQAVLKVEGRKSNVPRVPRKSAKRGRTLLARPAIIGSNESEIVKTLIHRFPITQAGQRNKQQSRVVGHLFSKNYPQKLIRSVVVKWLKHFEAKISTPQESAIRFADSCIASTRQKIMRGQFVLPPDHEKQIAEQCLSSSLENLLESLRHHLQKIKNGNGEKEKRILVLEAKFLEVILLFCQYQALNTSIVSEIKITDRQVRTIWCNRFDESIEPKQTERLKMKFFTRPNSKTKNRKAQKLELLSMRSKGRMGTPSVYIPSRELELALRAMLDQQKLKKEKTKLVRRAN